MSLTASYAPPKWTPRRAGPIRGFHPNIAKTTDVRYLGSAETAAMFRDDDDWEKVIAASDVVSTFIGAANENPPYGADGYLQNLVTMATSYRKTIGFEVAGPYGTVGRPTGASSAALDLSTFLSYVPTLGGTVGVIRMDGPLNRVITGWTAGTLAQAVDQTVEYMQTVHATYPDIEIQWIDQMLNWEYDGAARYASGTYGYDLKTAIDDLMADVVAANESLTCFIFDVTYDYVNGFVDLTNRDAVYWYDRMAAIQAQCIGHGMQTGIFVNTPWGGGGTTGSGYGLTAPFAGSNQLNHERSLLYAEQLRDLIEHGTLQAFDQVIVESWYTYPISPHAPDTVAYSFADTAMQVWEILTT